jgi:hypothetical protein
MNYKIIEMAVRDGATIGLSRAYDKEFPTPQEIVDAITKEVMHEIRQWTRNTALQDDQTPASSEDVRVGLREETAAVHDR